MPKKLYVGNLPFKATEEGVKDLFSQYGEVTSVNIVKDPMSGRARGFCFVEMENADEAASALNDKEFEGRQIKVDLARERQPRRERGGFSGGRGGDFNSRNRW